MLCLIFWCISIGKDDFPPIFLHVLSKKIGGKDEEKYHYRCNLSCGCVSIA